MVKCPPRTLWGWGVGGVRGGYRGNDAWEAQRVCAARKSMRGRSAPCSVVSPWSTNVIGFEYKRERCVCHAPEDGITEYMLPVP